MSSALDTLLEAARYIELQEQSGSATKVCSEKSNLDHRFQNKTQYNDNISNSINNKANNKIFKSTIINTKNKNSRMKVEKNHKNGMPSPPLSPNQNLKNNNGNGNADIFNNQQIINSTNNYGSTVLIPIARSIECRITNVNNSQAIMNSVSAPTGSLPTGGHNFVVASTMEDSSQSSFNLSSSGYLSGSSANSSVGGTNLNLSAPVGPLGIILHGNDDPIAMQPLNTRKRTSSTNSNGNQRSPCILRAGTREVHNKLEKHRRAHLKECFEQLKFQLQLKDEEKKKTSNLAILGAAYRHVISLRRKERELEQQVEQLAKEKINAQKKIVTLKRELSAKYDNIDFSTIISDSDFVINSDKETPDNALSAKDSVTYHSFTAVTNGTAVVPTLNNVAVTNEVVLPISPIVTSIPSNATNMKSLCLKNPTTIPISMTKNTHYAASTVFTTPSTQSPSSSSSDISLSSPLLTAPPITSLVPVNIKVCNSSSNDFKVLNTLSSCTNRISIDNASTKKNNMLIEKEGIATSSILNMNSILANEINSLHKDNRNMDNVNKIDSDKNVLLNHSKKLSCLSSCTIIRSGTENIKLTDHQRTAKVFKLFNGNLAVAPNDKDNKLCATTQLSTQVVSSNGIVVSQFPMLSSQGLRIVGTSDSATIELSPSSTQSQSSKNSLQQSTKSVCSITPLSNLQTLYVNKNTIINDNIDSNSFAPNIITSVLPKENLSGIDRASRSIELNISPSSSSIINTNGGKISLNNTSTDFEESIWSQS